MTGASHRIPYGNNGLKLIFVEVPTTMDVLSWKFPHPAPPFAVGDTNAINGAHKTETDRPGLIVTFPLRQCI